jgi:Raf kinase inhibitor-like YbhB/YbcL family protein
MLASVDATRRVDGQEEPAMTRLLSHSTGIVAVLALVLLLHACSNSSTTNRATATRSAATSPATVAPLRAATATPVRSPAAAASPAGPPVAVAPIVTSSAFAEGGALAARYTCDGQGVSPPLSWTGFPAASAAYVLIVDDPDAPNGTFTHWLVLNIPTTTTSLAEGVAAGAPVGGTGMQATNGARQSGYAAACPPPGPAHHYRFTVYALTAPLTLTSSATRAEVDAALQGHILAQGRLTGLYQRAARTPSPTPAR